MDADREFMQFSEQLRLHSSNLASNLSNLSLGETIWSNKAPADDRRSFENARSFENGLSDWKSGFGGAQKLAFSTAKSYSNNNNNVDIGGGGGKSGSLFGNGYKNSNNNNNGEMKNYFEKAVGKPLNGGGGLYGDKRRNYNVGNGKAGGNKKGMNNNNNNGNGGNSNGTVDKRFKTLPPEEALPRNEAIGGYIFVCNNDTMQENLRRQLFGLPQRYRDSVRVITPGLPLFLYNYSTHQLHGIFEAASFGGTNIDPTAWEDKKKPGESRFPAQVRVVTRKNCEPLEEDSFRPILHHYDGPKFRLELSVPEALDVLDKFAEQNA